MGAYLGLWVEFNFGLEEDHYIVEDLYSIYRKYGFKVRHIYSEEDISFEEAVKVNQKCYNERIDYAEHKEYKLLWDCGFTSFMISSPIINVDKNNKIEKYYSARRREMILFPENEITDEIFKKILELVTDLYKLNYVYSIEIQKEE